MNLVYIPSSGQAEDFDSIMLSLGFGETESLKNHMLPAGEPQNEMAIHKLCQDLDKSFKKYRWQEQPCAGVQWNYTFLSHKNRPLIYATFGSGSHTTLLLSGVHPDELTPIPIAFKFAHFLAKNPEMYNEKNLQVVVAPLVNPDGFFQEHPTRMNGNGVDVNRNFYTLDWYEKALDNWENKKKKNPRYFPGYFPNTEIETHFQVGLIDGFAPDKILSLHAPLGFLDYDGPGDQKPTKLSEIEKQAKQLVQVISEQVNNYRVVDYSFYPGSLGNYAGKERNIPTVTVELKTTDPFKFLAIWQQFLPGIKESIYYPFETANLNKDSKLPQYKVYYD